MTNLVKFFKDESGATAIEYGQKWSEKSEQLR